MSANISKERYLVNALRPFLIKSGFSVLQLVFPGGQSPTSLVYHDHVGKKRICYPDLLAFSSDMILLGEVKPRFSAIDERKLLLIKNDVESERRIKSLFSTSFHKDFASHLIIYALVHGQVDPPSTAEVSQLVLQDGTFIWKER